VVIALAATIGLLQSKQLQQVWETRILLLQHGGLDPLCWTTIFNVKFLCRKKECQEAQGSGFNAVSDCYRNQLKPVSSSRSFVIIIPTELI
jgi:hypothetical protein